MSGLYHGIRAFQVFGAGTNVGKTLVSAALVRAADAQNLKPIYIKPIGTGPADESDELHVRRYGLRGRNVDRARVLERLDTPVSPPLAAVFKMQELAEAGQDIDGWDQPTDSKILKLLEGALRGTASQYAKDHGRLTAIIETAGGILSPSFEGTPQADLYRHFRFPTVLVCDPNLGGISNSIAAFESLKMRGYDVHGTIVLHNPEYQNDAFLTTYFDGKVDVKAAIIPPPARHEDPHEDALGMERWYRKTAPAFNKFIVALLAMEERRERKMHLMRAAAPVIFWWPFTQHGQLQKEDSISVIDSARNDFLNVYDPSVQTPGAPQIRGMFDSSASWWTQAFGHGDQSLALEAAAAASRYGHVLYPRMVHEPAFNLAESLLQTVGKGWAERVFYSDNGSTGMEVAIKMAMRVAGYNVPREGQVDSHQWGVIGLRGAYHGDTLGAMDATQSDVFKSEWHKERGVWLDAPTIAFKDGEVTVTGGILGNDFAEKFASLDDVYNLKARLDSDLALRYREAIETTLRQHVSEGQVFGAVILEPLLMGAGGMKFVDPLFQNVLARTARAMSSILLPKPTRSRITIPVIFDEVFVGLGRLGSLSTAQALGVFPDIAVYAKMLTGGLTPLAATLATEDVFNAFLSENKEDALNHGHSYTANPVACAVAAKSMELIQDHLTTSDELRMAKTMWLASELGAGRDKNDTVWSVWSPEFVKKASNAENVDGVMTLGTVLAVRLKDQEAAGYTSATAEDFFEPLRQFDEDLGFGIHFRTLGNVAYFMAPSLTTPPTVLRDVEGKLLKLWGIEQPKTANAWRHGIVEHIPAEGGMEAAGVNIPMGQFLVPTVNPKEAEAAANEESDEEEGEETAMEDGGESESESDGEESGGENSYRRQLQELQRQAGSDGDVDQSSQPDESGQDDSNLSPEEAFFKALGSTSDMSEEQIMEKLMEDYLQENPDAFNEDGDDDEDGSNDEQDSDNEDSDEDSDDEDFEEDSDDEDFEEDSDDEDFEEMEKADRQQRRNQLNIVDSDSKSKRK